MSLKLTFLVEIVFADKATAEQIEKTREDLRKAVGSIAFPNAFIEREQQRDIPRKSSKVDSKIEIL